MDKKIRKALFNLPEIKYLEALTSVMVRPRHLIIGNGTSLDMTEFERDHLTVDGRMRSVLNASFKTFDLNTISFNLSIDDCYYLRTVCNQRVYEIFHRI